MTILSMFEHKIISFQIINNCRSLRKNTEYYISNMYNIVIIIVAKLVSVRSLFILNENVSPKMCFKTEKRAYNIFSGGFSNENILFIHQQFDFIMNIILMKVFTGIQPLKLL